jgi:hypothetical protein
MSTTFDLRRLDPDEAGLDGVNLHGLQFPRIREDTPESAD